MHPIELFESYRKVDNKYYDKEIIDKKKSLKIKLTQKEKSFHHEYTGHKARKIANFCNISLLYVLGNKISNYTKKEIISDAAYFLSAYELQYDHKGNIVSCESDEECLTRDKLLKVDPSKFLWAILYWNDETYKEIRKEDRDNIYGDISFTGFNVILLSHNSKTIKSIINYFIKGA